MIESRSRAISTMPNTTIAVPAEGLFPFCTSEAAFAGVMGLTRIRLQAAIYARGQLRFWAKASPLKFRKKTICRMKLLAGSLRRVMVGNQAPAPLPLYPHPGEARVMRNNLPFVLPHDSS